MSMYTFFADVLDYPEDGRMDVIDAYAVQLTDAEARGELLAFRGEMAPRTLGQRRELYTNAFDLRPECTPNLGYHMFGDDARRGVFLAELKQRMAACNLSTGTELPDHISLILRYLDVAEHERPPVIEDCLLPSVAKMVEILDGTDNPYKHILHAHLSFLRQEKKSFPPPVGGVEDKSMVELHEARPV